MGMIANGDDRPIAPIKNFGVSIGVSTGFCFNRVLFQQGSVGWVEA
jgi:hypothetical protein